MILTTKRTYSVVVLQVPVLAVEYTARFQVGFRYQRKVCCFGEDGVSEVECVLWRRWCVGSGVCALAEIVCRGWSVCFGGDGVSGVECVVSHK